MTPKYYKNKWDLDKKGREKNYIQIRAPVRYMIHTKNPGGLDHVISIAGFCDPKKGTCANITSDSIIKLTYPDDNGTASEVLASWHYNISGEGNLSESLAEVKSKKHTIVETRISNGGFVVNSEVSGDIGTSTGDYLALLAALNRVNFSTEKGNVTNYEHTKALDKLNKMADEQGLNEDTYISELTKMWKSGHISWDAAIDEAKIRVDKGKLSQNKFESFKNQINAGELGYLKDIERALSDLDASYDDKESPYYHNSDFYENAVKRLYVDKKIDCITYLKKIKGKVNEITYSDRESFSRTREIKLFETITVQLGNLKDEYLNKNISSSKYLAEIEAIWRGPDKIITDIEYQELLESESDTDPEFKEALTKFKEEIRKRQSQEDINELSKLG